MHTIKINSFTGVKIGDTINFYSTRDYTKIIKRKVSALTLSKCRDYELRIAFKIGNTSYMQLTREILNLNPQIKTTEVEAEIKLFKAVGKCAQGYGDITYYQWIIQHGEEEIKYSRLFSVDEKNEPYWFYNNLNETLPKGTREEIKNPKIKLTS